MSKGRRGLVATVTETHVSQDRMDATIARIHADLEQGFDQQIRWIVGWMTGLVASAAVMIIALVR